MGRDLGKRGLGPIQRAGCQNGGAVSGMTAGTETQARFYHIDGVPATKEPLRGRGRGVCRSGAWAEVVKVAGSLAVRGTQGPEKRADAGHTTGKVSPGYAPRKVCPRATVNHLEKSTSVISSVICTSADTDSDPCTEVSWEHGTSKGASGIRNGYIGPWSGPTVLTHGTMGTVGSAPPFLLHA